MQQVSHLPRNRNRQQVSIPAIVVATFLLFVAAGVIGWRLTHGSPPPADSPATAETRPGRPGALRVTSAKGAFSVVIPSGWDNALKVTNGDRIVLAGRDQPAEDATKPVQLEEAASYDNQVPYVLNIEVGSGFPSPKGEGSDLDVGSGRQLLSGKRYVYNYDLNGTDTQGHDRKRGDKDYIYSFGLGGGRELRVTYSVYAEDPKDQSATVDELVRSIRKLK